MPYGQVVAVRRTVILDGGASYCAADTPRRRISRIESSASCRFPVIRMYLTINGQISLSTELAYVAIFVPGLIGFLAD
jgi:hypothetical protein